MTLPLTNLLSTRGLDMSLSSTPGAVQSIFQQIFQSSVNLGQSNQDFKKSLNCRITRGKSPSPTLGALNVNPDKGLHTVKHFQAVPQALATRGIEKSP